jgi:hypothetical protein
MRQDNTRRHNTKYPGSNQALSGFVFSLHQTNVWGPLQDTVLLLGSMPQNWSDTKHKLSFFLLALFRVDRWPIWCLVGAIFHGTSFIGTKKLVWSSTPQIGPLGDLKIDGPEPSYSMLGSRDYFFWALFLGHSEPALTSGTVKDGW